jgi:hypothetical protein
MGNFQDKKYLKMIWYLTQILKMETYFKLIKLDYINMTYTYVKILILKDFNNGFPLLFKILLKIKNTLSV